MANRASQEQERAPALARAGVGYALAAYGFWGIVPLYWKPIIGLPAVELTAHRVLWGVLAYGVFAAWRGRLGEVLTALRDRGVRRALVASAALLTINWGTFVYAVATARVLEASLGYFINPLVSVVLGMTFLRERLRPVQWLALILAAAGVIALATRGSGVPWIALVLAASFGLYGLVRKTAPVDPLAGSAAETLLVAPVAAAWVAFIGLRGEAAFPRASLLQQLMVAGTGPVTAIPLVWFSHAARRLPLTVMGFLQYVGPTLQLAIAVFVFGEAFTTTHFVGFGLIWAGLAVFTSDAYFGNRR